MKSESTFSNDVLPEAVPPDIKTDDPCSIRSQKYAIILMSHVADFIRSTGVMGLSENILMVKLDPLRAMSLPNVACSLEPLGRVPSRRGFATDIVRPHRSESLFTKESSKSLLLNVMDVFTDPNCGSLSVSQVVMVSR